VLDRAVGMEQLDAIPWVVLSGRPNAGKSTLFNALLGRERAVVSGRAGTTRDVLAEPLALSVGADRPEVMLVDLAGADAEADELDRLVQAAARAAAERAELVLRCVPAGEPVDGDACAGELVVRTKRDLAGDLSGAAAPGLAVSAHRGEGIDELRREIAARLGDRAVSLGADAMALRPRHELALRSAADHLDGAIALVAQAPRARALDEPALLAAALRLALDDLTALAGNITPDDVLGRIFATFCIGK
jgi:tRNA modification GTPase